MNLSTLVTSVVVAVGGVGVGALTDVGNSVSGMFKHDAGASVSSPGATVAMVADLSSASGHDACFSDTGAGDTTGAGDRGLASRQLSA